MSEDVFVDVMASADLPEGGRSVVQVPGRKLALVRVQGVAWALNNRCPHHPTGQLGLGDLEGHHLYCPQHAWCFDVRTGKSFFPTGVEVRCFEVKEEGGRILVRVPPPLFPVAPAPPGS